MQWIRQSAWRTQPSNELAIQRERPLPGHLFCLTSIALSIELAKRVGFRAAADAMQILFDMLKIDLRVPPHDAIEQWTLRLHRQTWGLVDDCLKVQNPNWRNEDSSATRIGLQLLDWIEQSSGKLKAGERAWLSTEIIESLFGCFKQMERQHSKGGLTRMIAALPTLCLRVTPRTVREGFLRVDCKATQKWITDSLDRTFTARRNAAHRESKAKTVNHVVSAV